MKRITCVFCAIFGLLSVNAEVKLPAFFSNGMVLQQQTTARLWGWSSKKNVTVTTSWDNKHYTAATNKDGRFEMSVTTPTAGGPYEITFNDGQQKRLSNILIGEVWICSGQSNMEMQMKGFKGQPVAGTTEELLNCKDEKIRFFTVKRNPKALYQNDVTGQWDSADAASVRDFSATAYYFGKSLKNYLDVPVGLIVTSYGGSSCEAWMAREWLEEDSIKAEWPKYYPEISFPITDGMVNKLHQRCPSALYNGQLKPLIGYAMRGVIWYQGEDNVPRYSYYAKLMKRMVDGWRSDWQQGEFPFYYCQIAPYDYSRLQWDGLSPLLREQQAKVETMVENCRMAVLLDTGLDFCIHPRRKREAGERLAVLALAHTYDVKGLPDFAAYRGDVTFRGDTAVVAFDRSKEWVYFEHGPKSKNFEVAGEDRMFHPAEAWVSRNRVYVKSNEVPRPVAVRYAWRDWVKGDLMHDGLPVSSFRTDNWEPTTTTVSQSDRDYNNPQ